MENNRKSELLTYLSFLSMIFFFLIIILFHIFRTDHNPLTQTMSEYTIGPFGFLLPIALILLGLSSLLSYFAIHKSLPNTRLTNNSMHSFLLWAICITIAGIFPTDYITGPYSLSGIVHGVFSYFAFLFLPISHFYISLFYRKEIESSINFYRYQIYFYICLSGFIFYLISPLGYKGLTQRIFLGIMIITYIDLISIPLRKIKEVN